MSDIEKQWKAMLDISDQGVLRRYLQDKQVFRASGEERMQELKSAPGELINTSGELINTPGLYIRYFPGGVSGTVAFASDGEKSVIVKQALPFLKVAERWECDPRRMLIEHRALEVYERLIPQSVPQTILFDEENFIMVRQAAPEGCPMWKTQLLGGLLDFQVAEQAAVAMLAVHNNTAGDSTVRDTFIDDSVFYSLRINPYIENLLEKYPELEKKAKQAISFLMNEKIALVHGDYSPKNILVGDGRIYILDMEVAHFGHPAFDLAFFSNHFLLKSIKNKIWKGAYLNMLRYMLDIYFAGMEYMDRGKLEKDTAKTLGFLLLARVDGKSPAEYITEDADKELVRSLAFTIIEDNIIDFKSVIETADKLLA